MGPGAGRRRRWPWGSTEPTARRWPTSAGRRCGRRRSGAYPAGASAYGVEQLIGRRLGVDVVATSSRGRASPPMLYAQYSARRSSAATTGCCAADRGRWRRSAVRPSLPQLGPPDPPADLQRRPRWPGTPEGCRLKLTDPPERRTPGAPALRADVLAGLTATPEDAAAELVLRRARQRAVRRDHPAAGVLPDPAPSGRSSRPGPARSPRPSRRGHAGRARQRHVGEDPAAAGRAARRRHAAAVRALRRRPRRCCARRRGAGRASTRALAVARRRRRLRAAPAAAARAAAAGWSPSSGRTIGNLEPAQRAALPAPSVAAALRPATRFLLGTDLVKDRRPAGRGLRRRRGRDRGVQPQRAARAQPRAGAPTSTRTRFEHVALWDAEQEWIEMRLRSRTGAGRCASPRSTSSVTFAAGEEVRTEVIGEVPPRAGRGGAGATPACG